MHCVPIYLRGAGIYHIKTWRMDSGGCGAQISELLRRGWFIVLFADKTGVHRASTWCTFSEGSYSTNRITMDSDCVTSQLSGLNSCEFQLSVSFQLFAKTTPNAVDSQQKAAQMSGWKQTARKNVASVKVRWCKQPDMTRSHARSLRLTDFIIVCNL